MQIQIRHVPFSSTVVNEDAHNFFELTKTDPEQPDQFWVLNNAAGDELYSIGKHETGDHPAEIASIPVVAQDRGGSWTYHGPGQVSFVLIINVKRLARLAGENNRQRIIVKTLGEVLSELYGIELDYNDADPGLYRNDGAKAVSFGVNSEAWSWLATKISVNLSADLNKFAAIETCGIETRNMANLLNGPPLSSSATEEQGQRIANALIQRLYAGVDIEVLPSIN